MAKKFEYYIRRNKERMDTYEIAKFDSMDGGEQPVAEYSVMFNQHGKGKCNCQAATYRGTGDDDKHVKMVRAWLAAGEKTTAIVA